jgi:hypothetical protein
VKHLQESCQNKEIVMLHLAAIVVCIVFWPITLIVLGFMLVWLLLKLIFLAILGVGFAVFYPSQVFTGAVNTCCHPGNLTSEPGQMFVFWHIVNLRNPNEMVC